MGRTKYFVKEKNGSFRALDWSNELDNTVISAIENDNQPAYRYTEKFGIQKQKTGLFSRKKKGLLFRYAYVGSVLAGCHVAISCPVSSMGFAVELSEQYPWNDIRVTQSFENDFAALIAQHEKTIKSILQ